MYNSELDTFLAVAAAGSFSKAAKKIIYIYTSCRSANESIGKAVKCPAIC